MACVGSGPASLTAAGDLVQKGHDVTVFEALHEIGGVLVYGIPEFRLPKDIVRREVDNMRKMGVRLRDERRRREDRHDRRADEGGGYDAVFVATGAGLPRFLDVPGENLNGVYSANEFLTRVNLMKAYRFPEYDEPIYDCRGRTWPSSAAATPPWTRSAPPCASARRTRTIDLPPVGGRDAGPRGGGPPREGRGGRDPHPHRTRWSSWATTGAGCAALRCIRMALGEPDDSGRRRPVPVEGSDFEIPLDVVIVAVGTRAEPARAVHDPRPGHEPEGLHRRGRPETLRTSKKGVFAGGDIVTGAATVILAMGAGRKAARSIHEYLATGNW